MAGRAGERTTSSSSHVYVVKTQGIGSGGDGTGEQPGIVSPEKCVDEDGDFFLVNLAQLYVFGPSTLQAFGGVFRGELLYYGGAPMSSWTLPL